MTTTDAIRALTERAHHRARFDVIEDPYERGRIHALDDIYRILDADPPTTAAAVDWAEKELAPNITVVTGPPVRPGHENCHKDDDGQPYSVCTGPAATADPDRFGGVITPPRSWPPSTTT